MIIIFRYICFNNEPKQPDVHAMRSLKRRISMTISLNVSILNNRK